MPNHEKDKGFTLVEIVITLGIIALAGMIGWQTWRSYEAHACARYAAEQFVQDLRWAREQALVRASPVLVEFNINGGYAIYADPTIVSTYIPDKGTVIRTGELREKYGPPLTMTPTSGRIVFDYRGTLDTDHTTTTNVRFGSWPGVTRLITVLATGFSRVEVGGS